MKKLLFVIHTLDGGGAEKVLVNLVNNLPREKFQITVAAVFDGGVNKKFLKDDIEYLFLFKKVFRGNRILFKFFSPEFIFKKLVGKRKFDVVVSYLEGITARIVSGCTDRGAKKVCWIHRELTPRFYLAPFKSSAEAERVYASFDKIVCVSRDVQKSFLSYNPLFEKTLCLYNVNETDEIIEKSKEKCADAFLCDDTVKICFVGKLIESKGVLLLEKAHERLCEEKIDHRFVLVGTGPLQKRIEERLFSKGLEKDFVFAGYRTNPYAVVACCDIFALPSKLEGFSTAVTEALILKKPCVVTDCSGMKELLGEKNEFGIVSKNEEEFYLSLKRMIADESFRKKYSDFAAERGKAFGKKKTLEAHERFFDNLTGENNDRKN